MAKLAAQGGLRMILSGDKASLWSGKRILERSVGITRGVLISPGGARVWAVGRKSSRGSRVDERRSWEGKDVEEEGSEDEEEEEEEDEQFKSDEFSSFRGLVLDISYRPINVVCWKRAICLEFMDKADVLEYYDQTVSSPQGSFYIPAVLQIPHLLQVVKRRRVTACARCNSRKGKKTLEEANMKLLKIPKAPKDYDILAIPLTAAAIKMLKMRKGVPEEWLQYLSSPSP